MAISYAGNMLDYYSTGSSSSHAPALGFSPTPGNLLVARISTTATISSTPTGWTTDATATISENSVAYVCWKIAAGSDTITLSLGSGACASINIREYTGNAASTPFDVASSVTTIGAAGAFAVTTNTTATTAQNDELACVIFSNRSARTYSAYSGTFTEVAENTTTGSVANTSTACADQILTSTGTQVCTATCSSSSHTQAVIVTFKASTGGTIGPHAQPPIVGPSVAAQRAASW